MASISASGPARGRAPGMSLRGALRRVADAAVTPLELGDVLDVFHPLRGNRRELQGRIVSVTAETTESATLLVKPGRDWAGHVPGQYVRVGVDVDGVRLWRTYSLTHGPRRDRNLSFTVKAIPGGVVSNHLVHRAKAGQMLQLEQAEGEFVLPTPIPRKLLLVTAGSGITPVIGMLRNLFSRRVPVDTDITLVHVNQNESSAIFRDELRAHGTAGHLQLVERYDDSHGILDVNHLDELVPDLAERLTYACGPAGLLDALEKHHADRGLSLTTERFRPGAGGRTRRGRHHHLRRRPRGRGGRRHPYPRRRRRCRGAHAQRLPDGHLHGLRHPDEVRCGPRPAQRRHHHRRARRDRPRGRQDPDLHQRCCWCLPHR